RIEIGRVRIAHRLAPVADHRLVDGVEPHLGRTECLTDEVGEPPLELFLGHGPSAIRTNALLYAAPMLNSTLLSPLRSALVLLVCLAACSGGGGGGGGGSGGGGGGSADAPLYVSSDKRQLVDGSSNKPVLILGDSPQSLVVNLSVA